jgi:hypothetical protein
MRANTQEDLHVKWPLILSAFLTRTGMGQQILGTFLRTQFHKKITERDWS